MRVVRSAVRALIVNEGKLLTIVMQRPRGEQFYILPGGGQRHGETLKAALMRECQEEIGCAVVVEELMYVREYIGKNHTFAEQHRHFHQLEIVFRCSLKHGSCLQQGRYKDKHQIGIEWLPLEKIKSVLFYPAVLRSFVEGGQIRIPDVYLGDIN